MDILEGLNEQQRQAASHRHGPLLIVAGAGAGKTKTITHRIAGLVADGVAPESILAVTFTNKAAREMRERVGELLSQHNELDDGGRRPFVATFHALCIRILTEHHTLAELPRHFTIYDRSDAKRTVKRAMQEAGIDVKQTDPGAVLGTISWQKGQGVRQSEYAAAAGNQFFPRLVADVWQRYQAALARDGAVDFDDLLVRTRDLLEAHGNVRAKLQERFRYIHVDEYQDTNVVQDELLSQLAGETQNVCVVGDTDQSVYTWRGARPDNMLSFERRYPGTDVVLLEKNYRSTQTILTAANDVIGHNRNRFEKRLTTDNIDGDLLRVYAAGTEHDEARFIVQTIREHMDAGTPAGDIAVLYRANFQSRVLEEHLLNARLPYQVLGTKFFERKEVKDVLAFVRAAIADEPSVGDLSRIINVPPRGIGKATLARVIGGTEERLSASAREKLAAFRRLLADIRRKAETAAPSETIRYITQASGMEAHLSGGTDDDAERLENIRELVTLAANYDDRPGEDGPNASDDARAGIAAFLEHAALATDQDMLASDADAVRLMTAHAAKGLEFDTVFVSGLEEDLFPHAGHEDKSDPEEERRLFYVALTRACRQCYLTYAGMRTIYGSRRVHMPSSFFGEIDESLMEPVASPAGRQGGQHGYGYRGGSDGGMLDLRKIEF